MKYDTNKQLITLTVIILSGFHCTKVIVALIFIKKNLKDYVICWLRY